MKKEITKENVLFAQSIANRLNKRINVDYNYNTISILKTDLDGFKDDSNIQLSFEFNSFAGIKQYADIYVKSIDRLFIISDETKGYSLQENLTNGEIIYIKDNVTLNEILKTLDSILLNKKSSQTCLNSLQFNQTKALLLSMQILYEKGYIYESDSINILLDDYISKTNENQFKELKKYQDYIINKIDNNEI